MTTYPGLMKNRYAAVLAQGGKDWLRRVNDEDRRAWAKLGRMAESERDIDWQKLGGQARSKAAQRCPAGHMLAKDGRPCQACLKKGERNEVERSAS